MIESERIIKDVENIGWAYKYLNYLNLRTKGLRKQSQIELKDFFTVFNGQEKNERRKFINLICMIAFITDEYSVYLPTNMYNDIFIPEINDWIREEPMNAVPYKWSNDFENNRKAIELNSQDQVALRIFANRLIGKISMNQHEITSGYPYDGNPCGDVLLIEFFEKFVMNIIDVEKRENIILTLAELKRCSRENKKRI